MHSSQQIAESYSKLQRVLRKLLQGQQTLFTVSDNQPLLVLETSSDSVGFGLVNGNTETVFKSSYTFFKQLYRERHSDWGERNLSFVVCRSEPTPSEEAFLNLVEMDIYFCRKYVIRFVNDETSLERELLRLPFLPMMEGKIGGVVRPPSAQSLLKNYGINASLSRHLIVPGDRSASRIVEDVISQTEPLPQISGSAVPHVLEEHTSTERTRIKHIAIEGFRAYKKRQEFDVDADVVVLYGPNGLGKTSFFDAIDYVCTGRIGRLCRRTMNQEQFTDLARHLSGSDRAGSVTMGLSRGESSFVVQRKVDDWSYALVGENKRDRADTLQLLTSAKWGEKRERIENLERLFRATHLFSQTAPELLIEFEKDSTLSADLVSRTLSLEDYASGNKKLQEILAILEGQTTNENKQLEELRRQLRDAQHQINGIPDSQESMQAGQQLKKMATELVTKMRTDAGITVEDVEVTVDSVREWRAVIEAELKNAQDRLLKMDALESGFAEFQNNKKALKLKSAISDKLEIDLQQHNADLKRLKDARKKLLEEFNQSKTVFSQAKAKLDALAELKRQHDIAQEIQASLHQWNQELIRVEKEVSETANKLHQLLPAIEQLRTRKCEVQEASNIKLQRINTLARIQEGLVPWEEAKKEITEIQLLITETQLYIKKHRNTIDVKQRLNEVRAKDLEERERKYKELTTNQADLTRILDELELYIVDGVCPTCGNDYKTTVKLIERIHAQKQIRPTHVEELAETCRELKKCHAELEAELVLLNLKLESKNKELKQLNDKLVSRQEAVADFERLFEQVELSADNQEDVKMLASLLPEEIASHQAYRDNLAKLEVEEENLAKKINELQEKQLQEVEARKRANFAIEPLEQQMRLLRSKVEVLGLSLDMALTELTSEHKEWTVHKIQAEEQISSFTLQEKSTMQDIEKVEAAFKEIKANAQTVTAEREALEKQVLFYGEAAVGVGMPDSFELGHIVGQKKQVAERVEVLKELWLQALTLERVVDSAQRSAMLSELDSKVQTVAMQVQELETRIQRIATVKKWFSKVSYILNERSSEAVGNQVLALGPLTTLLQKRLRAVYGFGDINLHPIGNQISVVVEREGREIKPTDYFSDSQKQILMLSLFMSGRLTQTWSGFAPILMDDPVTHFDDLNAFGFVELVRGLVSASPGKRQFFISTCEERLFELMRQKFGKLANAARFYQFNGVSADGPVITKLEC